MQRNTDNGGSNNKSTATRTGPSGVIFVAVVPLIFFFYCFIVIGEYQYDYVIRHDLSPDALAFGTIFLTIGVFITCITFYYLGYIVVRKSSLRAKIILVICLFIFPLVYLVSLVESDRQTLEQPRQPRDRMIDLAKPTSEPPTPSGALWEQSDEEVCRSAIYFDELYKDTPWKQPEVASRPYLEEAGNRGYTIAKCAQLLGIEKERGG